jgi:hypothetical protein
VDTDELLIVLLTGGGLALIGTVLGALITQVFTIRIGREARREERRLAVKTFQRDTLVALQDDLVEAMNLFEAARMLHEVPEAEFAAARAEFEKVARRVEMHATRVRDDELRANVNTWLSSKREVLDAIEKSEGMIEKTKKPIIPSSAIRHAAGSVHSVYDRAGELIRTLDAIDEPDGVARQVSGTPTPRGSP